MWFGFLSQPFFFVASIIDFGAGGLARFGLLVRVKDGGFAVIFLPLKVSFNCELGEFSDFPFVDLEDPFGRPTGLFTPLVVVIL